MNCKVCENPLLKDDKGLYINERDKRYGICNACWERMQEEGIEESNEETTEIKSTTYTTKTTFLKGINIIQLIACIITAIAYWNDEETLIGFIFLFSGIVLFAFIKGFTNIIDLLDSINNKLKK